jgi:hypothetical protein
MLARITTIQVIGCQIISASIAVLVLALSVHFPDWHRRPEPQPAALFLTILISFSIVLALLAAAGVRSQRASKLVVGIAVVIVWLLGLYGLIFVWINTYGT